MIQHPTYASKYPPAQGLTLALGQVLTGYPIVGVWLSTALACTAICWMLAGWLPLRWAWLGGLLALLGLVFSRSTSVLDLKGFAYWSQSYWGGTVAALGGALVFGALPRIMKKQRVRDAVWLALGLAILANSRPFEGLVASIPVGMVLSIWIVRTRCVSWRSRFLRVILPVVLVLLLTASGTLFYNFQVTGAPFLMPYQANESTYGMVPVFSWQPLKAKLQYNHKSMSAFHRSYVDTHLYQRTFSGWIYKSIVKIAQFWLFFFGIIFTLSMPFLVVPRKVCLRRNVMFPLAICALMVVTLLTETWFLPHYAAPVACMAFLLEVESLRQVRLFTWRGKPVGQYYVRAVLPTLLMSAIASFVVAQYLQPTSLWYVDRGLILRELEQGKELHLVIVRYGSNHSPHFEWVYNRGDIDNAKVVWARDMDPQANRELLDYFQDRQVWLWEPDNLPRKLSVYPGVSP